MASFVKLLKYSGQFRIATFVTHYYRGQLFDTSQTHLFNNS